MRQNVLILIGVSLIAISQIILGLLFYPIILSEIKYQLQKPRLTLEFPPIFSADQEPRLIIPKINLNSEILSNIDPFNKKEYLAALSQGVAQASGSASPEEGGIFLFAHSTNTAFNISRYNGVFYLISKLSTGDQIYLLYQGKNYKYAVDKIKIVSPKEIQYLTPSQNQTLTLMTCWPPGTTLQRLLVVSHLVI